MCRVPAENHDLQQWCLIGKAAVAFAIGTSLYLELCDSVCMSSAFRTAHQSLAHGGVSSSRAICLHSPTAESLEKGEERVKIERYLGFENEIGDELIEVDQL
ncbi:Hypothetical predicted protein [Olea europaea subsp. europaea]|uniref:Uncharacterized protein n=1 Tax=Olea europaea subsp. europaea TaxID=158383 RepID=A0A8S0QIB0_OLEEU|nr:Hypothetical predicted protein [Olea europaea subsp. europaea]